MVRENQVKFIFLQFQVRFKARCLSVGCMGSCFHNKQILPGFGILKLINVNNQKELFSFRSRTDISLKRLLDYIIIFNRYANSFYRSGFRANHDNLYKLYFVASVRIKKKKLDRNLKSEFQY